MRSRFAGAGREWIVHGDAKSAKVGDVAGRYRETPRARARQQAEIAHLDIAPLVASFCLDFCSNECGRVIAG
jgi:hypothetical protein